MMLRSSVLFSRPVAVITIALSLLGEAQDTHAKSPLSPSIVPGKDILEKPIGFRTGIGLVHEEVTSPSKPAQAYYDQGLTFLHTYDWIDAARSFTEALRSDNNLAMAHMGLSYAFSGLNDDTSANAEENQALSLTRFVGRREATRIALREQQLRAIAVERQGNRSMQYVSELKRALAADPSNIELLILSGNAAEGSLYGRGQQGRESSIAYYKQILKHDAENAVAHHFLAHSYETLNNIEEARRQASMFVDLAPSLPHAHHMYGHELLRGGNIKEAVAQLEEADILAEKSWADDLDALTYDWHYRHNLNLLAAAYRHAGRLEDAEAALRRLAKMPCRSQTDEYYQAQLPVFLLEKGRYPDAVKAAREYMKPRTDVGYFFVHVSQGSTFANSRNSQAAAIELSKAVKRFNALGAGWKPILQPWIDVLKTQVEIAQSRPNVAAQRLVYEINTLQTLPGTDGWSDTLFHLEYLGEIAACAQLWSAARFSAERLRTLAPSYGEGQRLLLEVQGHQPSHSAK